MAQIAFNKRTIEALKPPASGRLTVYDKRTPHHCIRITPNGEKSFCWYGRIGSRVERITLGRFPAMTVEQAQRKAKETTGRVARGENPAEWRRAQKAELTLKHLFEAYLERHAKVHKRSWKGDEAQYNRYLGTWKGRKLSTIRRKDIQALHAKVGKDHGPYAANRLLALLHGVFEKGIQWGYLEANPASKITRFREQQRERFLQTDELPKLFESLAVEPNRTVRDYVLLSLLTGARRANVSAMQWEDVNLDRGVWVIPAGRTKTGSAYTVPLVPQAVELLQARQMSADGSPWVFPTRSKVGHLTEVKRAWKNILARAELGNLKIHDLRRTVGSWQAAAGASLTIIGKSLGHKNISTTVIYSRLSLDPVRDSLEKATEAMWKAGTKKKKKSGDVVALKR